MTDSSVAMNSGAPATVPVSTRKDVTRLRDPRGLSSTPVAAKTMAKSGSTGPEMKCFEPLRIQSSPSGLALDFMPITSEPASGSVSAKSSRFSPFTHGMR